MTPCTQPLRNGSSVSPRITKPRWTTHERATLMNVALAGGSFADMARACPKRSLDAVQEYYRLLVRQGMLPRKRHENHIRTPQLDAEFRWAAKCGETIEELAIRFGCALSTAQRWARALNLTELRAGWQPAELAELARLWATDTRVRDIKKAFPGRTEYAVGNCITRLLAAGKLERRDPSMGRAAQVAALASGKTKRPTNAGVIVRDR